MRYAEEGDDITTPRWRDDPRSPEFGPQGAALILELQRLRQAFETEKGKPRKTRNAKRRAPEPDRRRRPPPPPKRPRKSRMGKAIDVCLRQFGLKARDEPVRRHKRPPDIDPVPPRPASPTIAPGDDLLAMDLTKLAPDMHEPFDPQPSKGKEASDLALPAPAKPGTAVTKWVETCRTNVMAGVNFIVNGNDTTPPPEGNLSVKTNWSFERELPAGIRILLVAGVLGG